MREFSESMASFFWAMSLLGVQQVANGLAPPDPTRATDEIAATFESVTLTTAEGFGELIKGPFEVGDALQRGVVNTMFGILALQSLNPTSVIRMTCGLIQDASGPSMQLLQRSGAQESDVRWSKTIGSLVSSLGGTFNKLFPTVARLTTLLVPPADSRTTWQEFQNKWKVIQLVAQTDEVLDLPPAGTPVPLPQLVDKAYALEPFPALWAVEGLGDYYAQTFWEQDLDPRNMLTGEKVAALPEKSLTMLHAGMGLWLATYTMKTVSTTNSASEIRTALHSYIALVDDNSRKGYAGCALESLGLVTRVLYPEMVPVIDRHLLEINPEAAGYFWHGVGRGIYFNLGLLLPACGSPWSAVELCWKEAHHELALLNAIAGVAWAIVLVNMPNPEVMERLLMQHGEAISESGAFSNGLGSALIMRYDTTPDDPHIARFCYYQPDPSDPRLVQLWNRQVRRPCENALRNYYPALKKQRRLEEVFRYQSLSGLVERLERKSRNKH